jgi:hypothetical protein
MKKNLDGVADRLFLFWQIFQSLVYIERGDNSSMKEDCSQQILHLKLLQDKLV